MQRSNKVLHSTQSFVIPQGTVVWVSDCAEDFESFTAELPKDYEVKIGNQWYEIGQCDCCTELVLTYRDEFDRHVTASLKEVNQIKSKTSKLRRDSMTIQ